MTEWSLSGLLDDIGAQVERDLSAARSLIAHCGEKGGVSEELWRSLLRRHLPSRYQVDTGFVVDSTGAFSDQIDVIVIDRQYSPLVFEMVSRKIFPVECVYAVFEVKQSLNADLVAYARRKLASVRALSRTNLPVRDLSGKHAERPLSRILGGVLALDCDWHPPFGSPFATAIASSPGDHDRLDFGCIASKGWFEVPELGEAIVMSGSRCATAFLFNVISQLQQLGTVPMIDMSAYAAHLRTHRLLGSA